MSALIENAAAPSAFRLLPEEAAALMARRGLRLNPLSPLAEVSGWVGQLPQPVEALSSDPIFSAVLEILAQPKFRVSLAKGGGGIVRENFTVFGAAEANKGFVGWFDGGEEYVLLMLFQDDRSLVKWWVEQFASPVHRPEVNRFPARFSLETLVCCLHAVDSYRRNYLESLIRYEPAGEPVLSAREFWAAMSLSLQKGDERWLGPNLFALTPGLGGTALNIRQEHLAAAMELGFLEIVNRPGEEAEYRLGPAGLKMGEEFCHTWFSALGWEATLLRGGAPERFADFYLAPTAYTNHLFHFVRSGGGAVEFVHSALTQDDLIESLLEWLATAGSMTARSSAGVPSGPPQPPPVASAFFCTACGGKNEAGSKFCGHCGQAVSR